MALLSFTKLLSSPDRDGPSNDRQSWTLDADETIPPLLTGGNGNVRGFPTLEIRARFGFDINAIFIFENTVIG